jgi:hypothetical protein
MMRVVGLLPEGNIPVLNKQLQVEWFYMTFHKSDHTECMQSGCKLSNKTLQTLVEYFQSIHQTREHNGGLTCNQIKKIRVEAKCELRCKVEEQYAHKKAFSLISAGATGCRIDTTAATIVVSMADASSTSSVMMAVAETTNAMTGKVPLSAKTRTSSPVASTVSMPSTRKKSAMPTRAIKQNCPQTTTSAGTKVAILTTIATRVATMSCAGALILP